MFTVRAFVITFLRSQYIYIKISADSVRSAFDARVIRTRACQYAWTDSCEYARRGLQYLSTTCVLCYSAFLVAISVQNKLAIDKCLGGGYVEETNSPYNLDSPET